MDLMPRSLAGKRAILLASTAIIAVLSACQGSADTSPGAPAASSSRDKMPTPDQGGSY